MIENQSAKTLRDDPRAEKKQNEFNELVSQISADLESGQKVDWDGLKTRHPQNAHDLSEIRPVMDANQQVSGVRWNNIVLGDAGE